MLYYINKLVIFALLSVFGITQSFAQDKYTTWNYNETEDTVMGLLLSQNNTEDNSRIILTVGSAIKKEMVLNRANISPYNGSIGCPSIKTQCSIQVKFDNHGFEEYTIFKSANFVIEPSAKFINNLKKSKNITIEV